MRLEGVHHITAITADAPGNVDFYGRVLGLRLVKKTVNQDDPTVYHLFYADELGSPGADITFFEYPGARRGRAGAGMVHRVIWRVADEGAIGFWEERLREQGVETERSSGRLRFADPEGLGLELAVVETRRRAAGRRITQTSRTRSRCRVSTGVRAYAADPAASHDFLTASMEFQPIDETSYDVRGESRGSSYAYDRTEEPGIPGAGTVHHVAWSSPVADHEAWRDRVMAGGAMPTPVIDRFYFKSIYFREPSGVLFEIATLGPGFTSDEPLESLGERLSLPPSFEQYREQVERTLTPLPDPRKAPVS